MSLPTPTLRFSAAASALGLGLALTAGLAPPSASAKPATPQLSIAVDNGQTTTKAGGRSTYTITVTNLGTATVKNLVVSQTVPTGAQLKSADAGGDDEAGTVRWALNLRATKSATFHTTMTVAATTPEELLRLATVACAQTSRNGSPLVCASDSDQLPAGAAAEANRAALETSPAGRPVGWYVAAGLAAAAAAAAGVLALRRTRKAPTPSA